jgi:hypothetical protein
MENRTMNDTEWSNIDEKLYDLLINHFHLDLTDEKESNKYHGFRNDVMDLFNEHHNKKVNKAAQDISNIFFDFNIHK